MMYYSDSTTTSAWYSDDTYSALWWASAKERVRERERIKKEEAALRRRIELHRREMLGLQAAKRRHSVLKSDRHIDKRFVVKYHREPHIKEVIE